MTAVLGSLARVDPTGKQPPRPPFLERQLAWGWPVWPGWEALCVRGPRIAGSCLFCLVPPALNRESGGLGPPGFPLPCCWRPRARAEELGEALVIVRTGCGAGTKWSKKEWLGLASYCVCFPECPGRWHVLGDGDCSVGAASTFLHGLKFLWGQPGSLVYELVPAVLKACREEKTFSS